MGLEINKASEISPSSATITNLSSSSSMLHPSKAAEAHLTVRSLDMNIRPVCLKSTAKVYTTVRLLMCLFTAQK